MATRRDRRPFEPRLPDQAGARDDDVGLSFPGRHHRCYGLEGDGRQLDRESNGQESDRDQQLPAGDDGRWCCCQFGLLERLQFGGGLVLICSVVVVQDCQFWLAYLGMQCRLHELRHKRRISVAAASKILANLVYSYKGRGLSMVCPDGPYDHSKAQTDRPSATQGTMCAGVTPQEGPALYYIDSDGTRLSGNLFCVGSGQTFAYGVLDAEYRYDLTEEEALALGSRSILAATHRDAYSGGFINLYHVKEDGWVKHGFSVRLLPCARTKLCTQMANVNSA